MAHKYLEDIGIIDGPYNWRGDSFKWRHERQVYGFDSRECWNIDYTFYLWLYERLMKYLEDAEPVVDLTWTKVEYNGKTYTQRELIDMMLERLKRFLTDEAFNDYEEENFKWLHEIEKIWAVILPAMWW